jgi:hypothetical protein
MTFTGSKFKIGFNQNIAIGAVVFLLVTGLVIDLTIVSPRVDKLDSMTSFRHDLRVQLGQAMGSKFREHDAAKALGVENIALAITPSPEDPVSYLGHAIEASGLARLNMVTLGSKSTVRLERTDFSIRTAGTYAEIVDFVRRLETGDRLVTIDKFKFASHFIGDEVEGKFTLSIYDPKGR